MHWTLLVLSCFVTPSLVSSVLDGNRLHKSPLPRRQAPAFALRPDRQGAAGGLPSFLSQAQQHRNDGELTITTLRGQIKKQGSHDEVPAFRIFFEGKESKSNSEGFFSFPVELGHLESLTLVITKEIGHHFDKTNTIKHAKIIPDKNHRVFTYSKPDGIRWTLKEKTNQMDQANFVIPEQSSVVLVLDPKYVHTLQPWDLAVPDKTLHLPSIVLKSDLEIGKVERAAIKSLVGSSLDHMPFHEPLKERDHPTANNPKTEITLSH